MTPAVDVYIVSIYVCHSVITHNIDNVAMLLN